MALELVQRGWTNVRPLKGGLDAWRRAGMPLQPRRDRLTVAQAAKNLRDSEGETPATDDLPPGDV